mmetsp:Transcript_2660/g.5561  ORF Transcript_2660/g.5561 Transcript_2660/m.5561 type:complete len:233 (+) Transcript_2660:2318-3016(+)
MALCSIFLIAASFSWAAAAAIWPTHEPRRREPLFSSLAGSALSVKAAVARAPATIEPTHEPRRLALGGTATGFWGAPSLPSSSACDVAEVAVTSGRPAFGTTTVPTHEPRRAPALAMAMAAEAPMRDFLTEPQPWWSSLAGPSSRRASVSSASGSSSSRLSSGLALKETTWLCAPSSLLIQVWRRRCGLRISTCLKTAIISWYMWKGDEWSIVWRCSWLSRRMTQSSSACAV